MSIHVTCPTCGTDQHVATTTGTGADYCSIAGYRTGHGQPQLPSCHDAVTTSCPVCQHPFTPIGRQIYCSHACRAAAYRRRRDANRPPTTLPVDQPRRPVTVYECDTCSHRAVGQQRCDDCGTLMRRIGLGGTCPGCDHPIAVNELLDQEAAP